MGWLSKAVKVATFGAIDPDEGSDAARRASRTQVAATDQAARLTHEATLRGQDLMREFYNQSREDLRPQREVGTRALYRLEDFMQGGGQNALLNDPAYQFQLDQGQKAIERSAAARGGLFSGKTGKDLMRFSQGLASNEYGNNFNRLASLAGIGNAANTNLASMANQQGGQQAGLAVNSGNQLAGLATQAGNARASGYVGQYNANPFNANNLLQLGTQLGSAAIFGR